MIIKSKNNENSFIEIKDKITAGIRDRYILMHTPKISYNAKQEAIIDTSYLTEYEQTPNMYLLAKCITKVVEDGIDKTPKSNKVSDLVQLLDEDFYDSELLKEVTDKAMELYGFLEFQKSMRVSQE